MKRHKSLYPLSHDHHHALVQARKLRIASTDSERSALPQAATDFMAFWEASLIPHFRQEEEILLPAFSQYTSTDRAEILETLRQHLELRRLFGQLKETISQQETALAASGLQLAEYLEKHVRYEENYLFPAIEEAVPEEELWRVNQLLIAK